MAAGRAGTEPRRVHVALTCPFFISNYYDEARHQGRAAEAALRRVLAKYGFEYEREIQVEGVVGHPDFMRASEDSVEVVEVKNAGGLSYLHVLQLATYMAMLAAVFGRPVIGYLLYTKYRIILGSSPVAPDWARELGFQYVFLPIASGVEYIAWAQLRARQFRRLPGPYCAYCRDSACAFKAHFGGEKLINPSVTNTHALQGQEKGLVQEKQVFFQEAPQELGPRREHKDNAGREARVDMEQL